MEDLSQIRGCVFSVSEIIDTAVVPRLGLVCEISSWCTNVRLQQVISFDIDRQACKGGGGLSRIPWLSEDTLGFIGCRQTRPAI